MRKILTLLIALTLVAVSSACSSDDGDDASTTTTEAVDDGTVEPAEPPADLDDATEADYVAALSASFTGGDAEAGELVLESDDADCLAGRWVDAIGVDSLKEAEIAPSTLEGSAFDFTEVGLDVDRAEQMVAGFGDCDLDLGALVVTSLTATAPEDVQACAAENVDPDLVEAVVLTSLTEEAGDGQEAFNALIDDLAEACPVG